MMNRVTCTLLLAAVAAAIPVNAQYKAQPAGDPPGEVAPAALDKDDKTGFAKQGENDWVLLTTNLGNVPVSIILVGQAG